MGDLVAGIDLGGTKIAAALAAPDGAVLGTAVIPTEASAGPEAVVRRLAGAVRAAMQASHARHSDLARVAVGAPGPVDAPRGVVWTAPNLPGWSEVPVGDLLSSSLGVPVTLENDAHAATLAEYRCGAGRGAEHMVYITLGTGVGGGIIANGELYRGARGTAGEIGHMILDPEGPRCGGGHNGCLEQFTSGPALAREARLILQQQPEGLLWELCDGNPLQVTPQEVAAAALRGDETALTIIRTAAYRLGQAIASLAAILNPERVVIGGGAARMGDLLLEPAREAVREMGFNRGSVDLPVVQGTLGHQAGLAGAVLLALDAQQRRRASLTWKIA